MGTELCVVCFQAAKEVEIKGTGAVSKGLLFPGGRPQGSSGEGRVIPKMPTLLGLYDGGAGGRVRCRAAFFVARVCVSFIVSWQLQKASRDVLKETPFILNNSEVGHVSTTTLIWLLVVVFK